MNYTCFFFIEICKLCFYRLYNMFHLKSKNPGFVEIIIRVLWWSFNKPWVFITDRIGYAVSICKNNHFFFLFVVFSWAILLAKEWEPQSISFCSVWMLQFQRLDVFWTPRTSICWKYLTNAASLCTFITEVYATANGHPV